MFKDSHITRLDAWSIIEESDGMPSLCYPAFVGTGKIGIGLDAAGLQSLPETLSQHYNCPVKPFHTTQDDLYVLREGMISAHLWDDEIRLTGAEPRGQHAVRESMRNFMPMGYLTQSFEFDGEQHSSEDMRHHPQRRHLEGREVRDHARSWRRDWNLRTAEVRTSYEFGGHRRIRVALELFAPFGTESVYVKLTRTGVHGAEGHFSWNVKLNLQTRHGLPIFDQPNAVEAGEHTLLARIDRDSAFNPAEPYAVVYGIAAEGMELALGPEGWSATMAGKKAETQTAWLRLEFRRHAGEQTSDAPAARAALEEELAGLPANAFEQARQQHRRECAAFWGRTADVEISNPDEADQRRRFVLHMSEYLLRCGNEHALGGTVQFLLLHQNGWRACNFHDHHYIIDGLARANLWQEAEDHARWMHRVMHTDGRPFPWMMTYDGYAPIPPEEDRAPMSDANRALLAIRLYELMGKGRDSFLRDTIYPMVRAVAEHGLNDWFYEEDGKVLFRAVENDVMSQVPRVSETGTVIMFVTVLRYAIRYSEQLCVDDDLRSAWQRIVDGVQFERTPDGRYRAWHNAPDHVRGNAFFLNACYVAECQEYLDEEALRRSLDFGQRLTSCNYAWLNSAAASSEIRLGRPDRAEQFMIDSLENTVHGCGYFEEVIPNGVSSLPPFGTAHGAYLTAACEQIVLPDFWRNRVYVGKGLPSSLRARSVRFANLRALGGLLISGSSEPRRLVVELHHTGEAMEMEVVLRIPCRAGARFRVLRDGQAVEHAFAGESVSVRVALEPGLKSTLSIEG